MNYQQQYPEKRRFYDKLQKIVVIRIFLLLFVSVFLFLLTQYGVTAISYTINAYNHLTQLERSMLTLDQAVYSLLDQEYTSEQASILLLEPENLQARANLERLKWQFQERQEVAFDFYLLEEQGNLKYHSFLSDEIGLERLSYTRAICNNAKNDDKDQFYRAIYTDTDSFSDIMYVKTILSGDEISGYLVIFLSGRYWNDTLSQENYDGVITDLNGTVLYASKLSLSTPTKHFFGPSFGVLNSQNSRFWVVSKELEDYSAIIYSLVYYPANPGLVFGLLSLLAMSLCWLSMAKWISKTMADHTASSVENLVKELRIISAGELEYQFSTDYQDELGEVTRQISIMLNNIMELNQKNTDLIQLNALIEMEQLTAQMNPHFLYNTLELIRNLVTLDAARSEEILIKLTKILRYSVDSTEKEVTLRRDLDYIDGYLEIQSCRFGDRFQWNLNIDPSAMDCHIPKLLLQPLIENSIKYGFMKKMNILVEITIALVGENLEISVSDDGCGMEQTEVETLKKVLNTDNNQAMSIGLRNLSRRLYLRYKDKSRMDIYNQEGVGFTVYITIEQ